MMKSKHQIEDRLSELNENYRLSSDMYNPVLHARIQTLNWVLENEIKGEIKGKKYVSPSGKVYIA